MKKVYLPLSTLIVLMSATLPSFAANPCLPIANACKQAGYYRGGNTVGKGLIENCVRPIANQRMTLKNVTFPATVLQNCKMTILQKMKTQ